MLRILQKKWTYDIWDYHSDQHFLLFFLRCGEDMFDISVPELDEEKSFSNAGRPICLQD